MTGERQRPTPRAGVLDIAPYVPGRSKAAPGVKLHKLSSNETPLGPSPAAIAAFRAAADRLALYPDGSASELRAAIAAAYGLNAERIVCGAGSDEVLKLIAEAYIASGDEAIYSEHGFLFYPIAIKAVGGRAVVASEDRLTASVDAILGCLSERTRVVFLANPNNPTGTYLPFSEVRRLHAALPERTLLVLDAAYAEYVRRNDYESGIELAATADNVVMTRTFSKIHGLAGLRIGYAVAAPELAGRISAKLVSFPNSVGLHAALASLRDHEFLATTRTALIADRRRVEAEIDRLGRPRAKSHGNFVFFDAGMPHKAFFDRMLAQHIKIGRHFERYDTWARVTIGTRLEVDRLLAALPAALRA